MRTKNAKRLWPVPATLTVVALAALLAFGFLAVNGVQPAAAQDADCTITIDAELVGQPQLATGTLSISAIAIADQPEAATENDLACEAVGDTANIKFVGPAGNPDEEDDIDLYLLIEDKSGNLSFYGSGVFWQKQDGGTNDTREKGNFYQTDEANAEEADPTKYAEMEVTVPRAKRSGGRFIRQSTTISVQNVGKVHVYLPDDYAGNLVADFNDADCSPAACATTDVPPTSPPKATKFAAEEPGANAANGDSGTINITFLGAPVLGKDSDNDRNKILDDWHQCVTTAEDGEFEDATIDPDGNMADCGAQGGSDELDADDDMGESRSKLVVRTEDTGTAKALINGKSLEHIVTGDDSVVTIYALLEDKDGEALLGAEVLFTSSTMPSGIVAQRDLIDDPETEEVVVVPDAAKGEISIIGLPAADGPTAIVAKDAVAAYTLDNLPTDTSYQITVDVTVGSLKLGTVVISRPGDPSHIRGATFNADCLDTPATKPDDYDYATATLDLTNDDCEMQSRFGDGELVVVKAHLEDALDIVIDGDLEASLDGDDDALIPLTIQPDKAMAWIYMVDTDGDDGVALGDHMITVSHDENDTEVADYPINFAVAGPSTSLAISGDSNITLNGSVTYTVTAKDMLDGVPHLIREGMDDRNDMVTVSVQPTDALVVGTNAAGQVMLDDNGEATFIVYAALDAEDGEPRPHHCPLG